MAAATLKGFPMPVLLYPVIAEHDPNTRAWSVLSPDFPEIASFVPEGGDLAQTASDAIWTAVAFRQDEGEGLPAPTQEPWRLTAQWPPGTRNLLLHVPVPVPGEPVRVTVSLDKQLLEQIDREAERRNTTRSGILAEGAAYLLRG